ncbi:MAG: hypothetical protein MEP57_09920 [Microvirga sp.]|nr:hypothetical protein [Microvirga sp.]
MGRAKAIVEISDQIVGTARLCLDGNRKNADPTNWEPVPKEMGPRLSIKRGFETAPAELRPIIMAVTRLKHAAAGAAQKNERT